MTNNCIEVTYHLYTDVEGRETIKSRDMVDAKRKKGGKINKYEII